MMAVAKRGSAKIITPAADWIKMGASTRAHDQKESVLDLAVQPNDACETAKNLALAALAKHRALGAAAIDERRLHWQRSCHLHQGAKDGALETRHAELQDKLTRINHVGGIGSQSEEQQRVRRQPPGDESAAR